MQAWYIKIELRCHVPLSTSLRAKYRSIRLPFGKTKIPKFYPPFRLSSYDKNILVKGMSAKSCISEQLAESYTLNS
jgi:hypothetical protein